MAPFEESLRCLAVSVVLDEAGEVDGIELEAFLNRVAGRDQWLSTTEWLFVEPPAEAEGQVTVPVVVPETIAIKAVLADLTNEPQRILFDHQVTPTEARKWRYVSSFQADPNADGRGNFPWECIHA